MTPIAKLAVENLRKYNKSFQKNFNITSFDAFKDSLIAIVNKLLIIVILELQATSHSQFTQVGCFHGCTLHCIQGVKELTGTTRQLLVSTPGRRAQKQAIQEKRDISLIPAGTISGPRENATQVKYKAGREQSVQSVLCALCRAIALPAQSSQLPAVTGFNEQTDTFCHSETNAFSSGTQIPTARLVIAGQKHSPVPVHQPFLAMKDCSCGLGKIKLDWRTNGMGKPLFFLLIANQRKN